MKIIKSISSLFAMVALSRQMQFNSTAALQLKKGRCGDKPGDICRLNRMQPVGADAQNINALRKMMCDKGVKAASVASWNGQICDLVLRENGALAPYNAITNDTSYAFCMASCPCPSGPKKAVEIAKLTKVPGNVPAPQPVVIRPSPPPMPKPLPNPGPNVGGSCTVYAPAVTCPNFVAKCRKENLCPRKVSECSVVCGEFEKLDTTRRYVLDARLPRTRDCQVKLEVNDKKMNISKKCVLLSGAIECDSPYPNILRFPENLAKIAKCLNRKYGANPCLYVGGRDGNQLFVYLNGCIYYVPVSLNQVAREKFRCSSICLEKVGRRGTLRLAELGLAKIDFSTC